VNPPDLPPVLRGRGLVVFGTLTLTLAGVGFLAGARPDVTPVVRLRPTQRPPGAADSAPAYAELREQRRGPNAAMYAKVSVALAARLPRPGDPVPPPTEADRVQALAARAGRRAYDGAPPTVPHPVLEMAAPNCLACHERGARIGDKVAPLMSHDRRDSCLQCHVPAREPPTDSPAAVAHNSFAGLASYGPGGRAWPGAPPTIPHPTLDRGRCDSCHGPTGAVGLRTPHPDRQSCTQCHSPSAVLDQRHVMR
jgi:cytochrome c-type protein NapB